MELSTIEMPREEAEAAFQEYRTAVRATAREKYGAARREYDAIDRAVMRGYKEIAKGHALIKLSEAILAGGTKEVTWTETGWREDKHVRTMKTGIWPKLAVCRADARQVHCAGVRTDGSVLFKADGGRNKADEIRFEELFGEANRVSHWRDHQAIVPTIPPPFRPQYKLSGYHLLWEAEWTMAAPVDPALLKHLGGDLYAVLAVWDLTELERAVLGGIRA
jgi:hypothetical protein